MRLELTLRKVGNSLGVVLPKEALSHLGVEEGDTISVTGAADGTLRVSAHDPDFARQMDAAKSVMRRYRILFANSASEEDTRPGAACAIVFLELNGCHVERLRLMRLFERSHWRQAR